VKIAIVVPIGPLDRFGYQHIYRECIESMANFADQVFLVSTTREVKRADNFNWPQDKGIDLENLNIISDSRTWFARTPEGDEWFDAYKVLENVNVGVYAARSEGVDVVMCLFCNNYIPEMAYEGLRARCEKVATGEQATASYYRKDQLYNQMFSASVSMPFIINSRDTYRFAADAITNEREVAWMQRGDFSEFDGEAVVDVQLEVTTRDLREKMNFMRCYSDLVPKRKPEFDEGYWLDYYVKKFQQKKMLLDSNLDKTGQAIARLSQPDFASRYVLEQI